MKNQNPIWIQQKNYHFNWSDNRLSRPKIENAFKALEYNEKNVVSFSMALSIFGLQCGQMYTFKGLEFYYKVGMCRSKIVMQIRQYEDRARAKAKRDLLALKRKKREEKLRAKNRLRVINALEYFCCNNVTVKEAAEACDVSKHFLNKYITLYFKKPAHNIILQSKINFT